MKISAVLLNADHDNEKGYNQAGLRELADKGELSFGKELLFRYEPWEKRDINAVAVFWSDGRLIGFLPADVSSAVCERVGSGDKARISVDSVAEEDSDLKITVSVEC